MTSDARTLRTTHDDGFHEIHLSGKQLVFLFMATTLVSIVIFLCGVLVGRGARVQPTMAELDEPPAGAAATGEPVIDSSAPGAKAEPGQPTAVESGDFNYFEMLTAEQQTGEVPQPPAEASTDTAAAAEPPPAPPAPEPAPAPTTTVPVSASQPPAPVPAAAPPAAAAATTVPASLARGEGLTIQVAALKERSEAERVATRLSRRGYEAYVADPAPGTSMYRVRVGRFTDRAEADRVKNRLAREEKFKPWITR